MRVCAWLCWWLAGGVQNERACPLVSPVLSVQWLLPTGFPMSHQALHLVQIGWCGGQIGSGRLRVRVRVSLGARVGGAMVSKMTDWCPVLFPVLAYP